jgi:hypothetical protein
MIDDASLERGLRARPPADPAYRSRVTATPPTAIRPRPARTRHAQPGRTRPMLTATRLIAAVAMVSLGTGALLLSAGGAPSPTPVSSPSPTTTRSLLSGMVTEEVEPGVYRVDSDGIRPLSRPMGTARPDYDIHRGMEGSVAAGLDGSVWWFDQAGFFRLGDPVVHTWPNGGVDTFGYRPGFRPDLLQIDIEVGSDGTVWLAREVPGEPEDGLPDGEISSFDGASWSVHQQLSDGHIVGVEVLRDGDVWGAWSQERSVTVARLGDAGWEPLPGVAGDMYADLSVAAAGGGEVWLMPGIGQLLQRHDGDGWAVQSTPDAGYAMRADAGPDGTLWVRLSPTCGPGCIGSGSDLISRFDGANWEVFDASDGIPVTGHHTEQFYGFFEAAPDRSVWFDPSPQGEGPGSDCDGVANFDGQAVRRHLRGMCIYAMDVAPDGAVWLQGRLPTTDDTQPIDTYVITPQAVAAVE